MFPLFFLMLTRATALHGRRGFMETISSDSNSKYKLMKSLQVKKYREKENLVFVEGHRTIIDAIKNGLKPTLIFASNRAFESPLGEQLYSIAGDLSCVNIVGESLMKRLVDTVQNQGVCAAFIRPVQPDELPIQASMVVLCDGVSDPGNLGTIFRTSYGLGVDCVLLSEDCCDPFSPKTIRASMGTVLSWPNAIMQCSWNQLHNTINDRKGKEPFQVLICDANGVDYDTIDFCKPSVIVLGSEAVGVNAQQMQLFQNSIRVKIPMTRGLESFNVGAASSIMLGEAARQRRRTNMMLNQQLERKEI